MAKTNVKLRLGSDRKQNDFLGMPDYPCEVFYTDLASHSTGYMPEHWHNELEYGFVTKGKLLLTCNGTEYVLKENQFYFINTNALHSMKATDEPASFYSIVFRENFLSMPEQIKQKYILPVMENANFPVFATTEPEFLQLIRTAIQCYEEKEAKFDYYFHRHICSIWMLIYDKHLPVVSTEEKTDRRIQGMLQFISSNYHHNIGVKEIADFGGVSKRECFRCFKRQLNSSPNIYLLQFRMNRAAEMILMTDKKINQIAALCGFSSATYFATKFKEIYGISPKVYREENRKSRTPKTKQSPLL